ncbi:MAG: hypothetical protein ABIR46_03090 [Candidatus Saccharimonadales bacterium]
MYQLPLLGFVLAVPFLALLTGVYLVKSYNIRSATKHKFYALTFPSELTAQQALDWWASVASTFAGSSVLSDDAETVVIELRSDMRGLTHRLGIPWQHTELLAKLRAHVTGVHIEEHLIESVPEWSHAEEVGLSDVTRMLDIKRIEAVVKSVLSASAHDIGLHDHIGIQIVMNPTGRSRQLSDTKPARSSSWGFLGALQAGNAELTERRAKLTENQFKIVLRFVSASTTPERAKWLVGNVKKSYKELNTSTAHLKPTMTRKASIIKRFNNPAGLVLYPAQVSASELVALSAWPIGTPPIPGLSLGKTRYLPPNETIARDGRKLGTASATGYEKRPVGISAIDATRHMYVIGPSGYGKTTLLSNSLQQDIENGYGVVVMESKGDLFRSALNAVPRERIDDVVVMDLTDHDYPVGLNLLHEGDKNVIVDDLIRLFVNGASDALYLPEMMYHGLHTLRHFPELTIIDLLPFLQPRTPVEKAWREHLIDQLPKGGEFHSFWKGFDTLKQTEQNQKIRPVANRMWQLSNRRDIKNMLGQSKSTINMREIMEQNKLLFIYIPDSIGDDTVSLLASLIVSHTWDSVRSVTKDKPTYLYMDEVQRFMNLPIDLADMLSLARSYKFGLVMAHQYTSQLPPALFSAITNASTQIAFKLDGPDAGKMQHLMGKAVTAEDFINLDAYEAIARIATPGGSSAPTTIKTFPQFKPHGHGAEVVRRSREQFARKAETVDKEILVRRTAPSKPVKARPSFGDVEREGGG